MCDIVGNTAENKIEEIQALSNKTTDNDTHATRGNTYVALEIVAKKRAICGCTHSLKEACQWSRCISWLSLRLFR
jgi:hypothetical protein